MFRVHMRIPLSYCLYRLQVFLTGFGDWVINITTSFAIRDDRSRYKRGDKNSYYFVIFTPLVCIPRRTLDICW